MQELLIDEFLKKPGLLLDVRSPSEFAQGHIPGAVNLSILDDSQRAQVGTTYKQKGREEAVELGFHLAGPHLSTFIATAKNLLRESSLEMAKVHCWRGGLRSATMAWLLHTAGLKAVTLKGGYKTFRRESLAALDSLDQFNFKVLGGLTGSGKTAILSELCRRGAQVIDLEHLAKHRGSSFGRIGMPPQPSNEQFENEIVYCLSKMDPELPIWIEDESRMIGACKIPDTFFKKMRQSPLFVIEIPKDERIKRLVKEYEPVEKSVLIEATLRIGRHLGGAQTKIINEYWEKGLNAKAIELILNYYDRTYQYGLSLRQDELVTRIKWEKEADSLLPAS